MTLTITINMDNAAFEDAGNGNECARILRCLAGRIMETNLTADGECDCGLYDLNGNKVGKAEVTG